LKWLLASPLRTLSPLGLLAVGAVVGVAGFPVLKKTARSLAVLTVKSALTVSDVVKDAGESLKSGWGKMAESVKTMQEEAEMDRKSAGESHPRTAGRAADAEGRDTAAEPETEADKDS